MPVKEYDAELNISLELQFQRTGCTKLQVPSVLQVTQYTNFREKGSLINNTVQQSLVANNIRFIDRRATLQNNKYTPFINKCVPSKSTPRVHKNYRLDDDLPNVIQKIV